VGVGERDDSTEVLPVNFGIQLGAARVSPDLHHYAGVMYRHTPMTTVHPIPASHPDQHSENGFVRQ
jgi:hypothetical protein